MDESQVINEIRQLRDEVRGAGARVERLTAQMEAVLDSLKRAEEHENRITRIETRLEMAERQNVKNQWVIGLLAVIIMGILAIGAQHLNWH